MIQEDFEQHVVKLQGALLGFAKSLTHNDDEAKDLWQETALKALVNKEISNWTLPTTWRRQSMPNVPYRLPIFSRL